MPALWSIENWPPCEFHVFVSHCAEDRERIAIPIYRRLQTEGITPWIDRHDYPSGRDPLESLRENLLRCRHVVYLITPSMLRQPRGWTVLERAFSELIQQSLHFETFDLQAVELPLFLIDRSHRLLPRSIWSTLVGRGKFIPPRKRRVEWCVAEITHFLDQEQRIGQQMATSIRRNPRLKAKFGTDPNLRSRVTAALP